MITGNSLSGMKVASLRFDVSANNVANINSSAYKAQRIVQSEMSPGVEVSDSLRIQAPGSRVTNNYPLELAIQGNGYFTLLTQGGQTAYTKNGSFRVDENGRIVHHSGAMLIPPLTTPPNVVGLEVNQEGVVDAITSTKEQVKIGEINLAGFKSEDDLEEIGNGLYAAKPGAGKFDIKPDGVNTVIIQGETETSNVSYQDETVESIRSFRSFQANARAFKTDDEMQGTIIDLAV